MTTHQLARYLLDHAPDLPVEINGWGSYEGCSYEVTGASMSEDGMRVLLGHGWRCGDEWQEWGSDEPRLGPPVTPSPTPPAPWTSGAWPQPRRCDPGTRMP